MLYCYTITLKLCQYVCQPGTLKWVTDITLAVKVCGDKPWGHLPPQQCIDQILLPYWIRLPMSELHISHPAISKYLSILISKLCHFNSISLHGKWAKCQKNVNLPSMFFSLKPSVFYRKGVSTENHTKCDGVFIHSIYTTKTVWLIMFITQQFKVDSYSSYK